MKAKLLYTGAISLGIAAALALLDTDSEGHPTMSVIGNEDITYLFTSILSDPAR